MDPCVTCGTTDETTSVCTCDCQCLETARQSGCREIKLIAPTRDTATAWAENDPILPEGVFALVKDRLFEGSVEYIIGDGESKYSELIEAHSIYAGAPLSRTGAENHSPLAASGESTLDPSWLPDATSSAKGAVMTSTTGAAGKVPIAASGVNALDPSWLPAATSSALGGVMTSTTGAEGKVPITGSGATALDPSWLPDATSSAKGAVKASTTKAANNVVKADANGGLDGWQDAIIDAIIADDGSGGLITDDDGNLAVDFSQMPTDKFEALLKSLKLLIPLEANRNFYVDKNHASASDNLDPVEIGGVEKHRGDADLPFKTIQACVNYVTQNYAINDKTVTIYVAQATYDEHITLPDYSKTSGRIILRALDYQSPPTISATHIIGNDLTVTGSWDVTRINVASTQSAPNDGIANMSTAINVSGGAANLQLRGCSISMEYTGDAPSSGTVGIRCLTVQRGASCTLNVLEGYKNAFSCVKNNATVANLVAVDNRATLGTVSANTPDDGIMYDIPLSGTVDTVLNVGRNSSMTIGLGSLHIATFSGNITGKKYSISQGSNAYVPTGGIPGDVSGTVEDSTYCWYKQYGA